MKTYDQSDFNTNTLGKKAGKIIADFRASYEDAIKAYHQRMELEARQNIIRRALADYEDVGLCVMEAINNISEPLGVPRVRHLSQIASKTPAGFTRSGQVYLEYTGFYSKRGASAQEVSRALQNALDDLTAYWNYPRLRILVQYRANFRMVIRVVCY